MSMYEQYQTISSSYKLGVVIFLGLKVFSSYIVIYNSLLNFNYFDLFFVIVYTLYNITILIRTN